MEPETPSSFAPADQQPSIEKKIFLNDRGLRAGWRLAIYVAILVCLLLLSSLLVYFIMGGKNLQAQSGAGKVPSTSMQFVAEAGSFLLFLLAAFIMSRIERRNIGDYGLPLKGARALQRFVTGYVVWGFLPLFVCLSVLYAFHAYDFGQMVLHGNDIWIWGLKWFAVFIFVGLSEEYLLRGYTLFTLADGIGFWPAAIFMAALFGLGHAHNAGETRIGLIATVVFALFASITLRYTGNLWLAVGAHAGWDWGQSFFFGVSDSGLQFPGHLLNPSSHGPDWLSGGTVGPEGSVVTLILWIVMSGLVVLVYRKPSQPALVITEAPKF
jgi:membrane protease YdiL (CAAX protease family)